MVSKPITHAANASAGYSGPPPALPFPSLFEVSCHWSDPWLVAAGTRTGKKHATAGATTDDAVLVSQCGPHVLLAIADGAGDPRATRSAEAAKRAVAVAAAEANRGWSVYGPDTQLLVEAMAAARVDLVGRAEREGLDPVVYATTLLLVLLAGSRIIAARIGDGSIYTWDGKGLTRFCGANLPATSTPMLTIPTWRDWVTTADSERDFIIGLALCSDGADDFFLDDGRGDRRVPSDAMVKGLSAFCDQYGPNAGISYVMQMLNDPNWARKTDDDRSVIVAFKPQSAHATPKASPHATPDTRLPG